MASYRDAFIGAVLGAVATPLVAAVIFLTTQASGGVMNTLTDAVLNRLQVELEWGIPSTNGADYYAQCRDDEKPWAAFAITSGEGTLQNAGLEFDAAKNQ
jgi:hypothetical protein